MIFPIGHFSRHPDVGMRLLRNRWFRTEDIFALVGREVLLLAGSEDHYSPIGQWYRQLAKNAHSITARLFARGENAPGHRQVGNVGLAQHVIVNGLDQAVRAETP